MQATLFSASILALLLASTGLRADSPPAFDTQIRPLLQQHCVECHGPKKQKGELRLDAKPHAFKGGHDGPAILPGKAEDSPIFQRVTS